MAGIICTPLALALRCARAERLLNSHHGCTEAGDESATFGLLREQNLEQDLEERTRGKQPGRKQQNEQEHAEQKYSPASWQG